MDHSLIMHIDQALCNVAQLWGRVIINNFRGLGDAELETNQFEPVYIPMPSHKLIDVPIGHPLRHHCELILGRYHSY